MSRTYELPTYGPRWLLASICIFLGLQLAETCGGGTAPDDSGEADLAEAWQKVLILDYHEAEQRFRNLSQTGGDPTLKERAWLGLGGMLLTTPPRTPARLAEAEAILTRLYLNGSTVYLRQAGAFWMARAFHAHRLPPDPQEAMTWYQKAHALSPESRYGQHSLLKMAALDLAIPSTDCPTDRAHQWYDIGDGVQDIALRRNLLRNLVNFLLREEGDWAFALSLALEADELGFTRPDHRSQSLLRIARLADFLQKEEIRLTALDRFLDENPRSVLRHLAEEWREGRKAWQEAPPRP